MPRAGASDEDLEALLHHKSLSVATDDVSHALARVREVSAAIGSYALGLDAWIEVWAIRGLRAEHRP